MSIMNPQTANGEAVTAADIRRQVQLIQQIKAAVMQKGTHYDVVPGCGDRPTLLKPGAEKLLMTFKIFPRISVENLSRPGLAHYIVTLDGVGPGGEFLGAGVGECSSNEDKYAWRRAACDEEFDAAAEEDRRVKWYSGGASERMVRQNPANVANTILKMAKKRALVDLALTATAASDLFTQDLDELGDIDDELPRGDSRPRSQPEARRPRHGDQPPRSPYTDAVNQVQVERRDDWSRYDVHTVAGYKISTFDAEVGTAAQEVAGTGQEMLIRWGRNAKGYLDLISIEPLSDDNDPGQSRTDRLTRRMAPRK
jgi:hypothetical protein